MTTTTGAMHGTERACIACGLTYRYPRVDVFKCQSCGVSQVWDAVERAQEASETFKAPTMALSGLIDLRVVHGYTNTLSNDALRRLHDQLAILNLVDEANRWRHEQTGHFQQVKAVLANAGVRFET